MVRTAALVGIALVSLAGAGHAQQPRAQYKNATLGMTLDAWKLLPFPDGGSAIPLCSDNPKAMKMLDAPFVTREEQALGIVVCHYYVGSRKTLLSVGENWKMMYLDYAFFHGRLYRILGAAGAGALGDVVQGLTARFGPPTSTEKSIIQNRLGGSFPRVQYRWEVGDDAIQVSAPAVKVNMLSVAFVNKPAIAAVQAEKDRRDPPADKM